MPELCRFRGIIIRVHSGDHPPPHIHIDYGGADVAFDIEALEEIRGNLPTRVRRLVVRWARIHQDELRDAWDKASRRQTPERIAPLR